MAVCGISSGLNQLIAHSRYGGQGTGGPGRHKENWAL